MFNLICKTLYDKRAFIIGWGLGLAAMALFMVIFYPAFSNDTGLEKLLEGLPQELKSVKGLIGNLSDLKNLPGYLGGQLFEIRLPILLCVLSIILAVGLSITEEEKGYIRTLLSLPVGRSKLLTSKLLAIVVICFVTSVMAIGGVCLGLLIINDSVGIDVLVRLGLMTWLVTVCMTTIVFGIGLATGKRGVTMGLGAIVAVGSFILTTFAKSVEWLQPYEKMSLFHYFPATEIAKGSVDLKNVIVLVTITLVMFIIGLIFFRRRDVR